jgi:diguanylate cyclase (GGDEF)-like protein
VTVTANVPGGHPAAPGWWRRIWQRPEARLSDAGFHGEMLVAGVRLLVVLILVYIPADEYIGRGFGPEARDPRALLTASAAALVGALLIYSAVNRNWGRSWIGFASSILDVTLVSALLAVFLLLDRPHEAVNNAIIFPAYFLAIAATSLRYDSRVCLVTGALAVAEYGAIVFTAQWLWDLNDPSYAPFHHGVFSWDAQVARLAALAAATMLAVTLVVRARELRHMSSRDRFTGLLNRATLDERLRQEAAYALSVDGALAVGMIDIDHFKRFNDRYGHGGGDQALRRVSRILRGSFRETDAVARYGGEEFCVLLPGVDASQARPLFERIRRTVETEEIPLDGWPEPARLTVSVGVAVVPHDGAEPRELLERADRRLYEAKQGGRNRVIGPAVEQETEGA